jgi:diaminopimelate decarboxylase
MMASSDGLVERVKALGVDISDIKRIKLSVPLPLDEAPNVDGKRLSLQILTHIAAQRPDGSYVIGVEEAHDGLEIFKEDQYTKAERGVHPTVDLLKDIATGVLSPVTVEVVEHPKMEVLPADRINAFKAIAEKGTPAYGYFEDDLRSNMQKLLAFPAPFGVVVRYAMKANPNAAILRLFDKMGAHIDASSPNECFRAIEAAGIAGEKIRLTSQRVLDRGTLEELVGKGIKFTATSLKQLEEYGKAFPGSTVAVRFNVGIGSGWTNATSTGGVNSSFGIYEQREEIDALLSKYRLTLDTIHLHIGSGSDPEKQKKAALKGIELAGLYPTVKTLNLGGGFKVARMNYEKTTDLQDLGAGTRDALKRFAEQTGRELLLEIEPGTAAVANAGYVVARVMDIASTGKKGYTFLKVDTGMTENTRISLYAAQHPLAIIPMDSTQRGTGEYVVTGQCCESGDVLTPQPGIPESIDPRRLTEAKIGDLLIMGGAGAYCAGMNTHNYNSYPESPECLVRSDGKIDLIREREPRNTVWGRDRIPKDLQ